MKKDTNSQQQGRQANTNGDAAEMIIFHLLKSKGYSVEQHRRDFCLSIYGKPIIVDLYVAPCQQWPTGLALESKWQQTSGSVDEKYPFLVANIKERFPCPCIVILDGAGYRPAAAEWLRQQVDGQKLIGVYTLAAFLTWCNAMLSPNGHTETEQVTT